MSQFASNSDHRETLLSFKLVKRYRDFTLDCSGDLREGITAVYGLSGSGKTTLLNCIAGLTTPTDGQIELSGRTVYSRRRRVNIPPDRRRFGYVFQDSALFPHMTVIQNLLYGYRLTPASARRVEPEQLVEMFGLGTLLERGVGRLSGGERQRVALARALATSPDLLLLDEPLSSLDVRYRGVIIQYLRLVRRELGTSMLYVTHSISEVLALASSALVLDSGRSVAHLRPTELAADPHLSALSDNDALENMLEGVIAGDPDEDGLTRITVGRVELLAPSVEAAPGDTATIAIRAADVIISLEESHSLSARNIVPAVVEETHALDGRAFVYLDVGVRLAAEITLGSLRALKLRPGSEVWLILKTAGIVVTGPAKGAPYRRR